MIALYLFDAEAEKGSPCLIRVFRNLTIHRKNRTAESRMEIIKINKKRFIPS